MTNYQLAVFLIHVLSIFAALALAVYARRRKHIPGTNWFAITMIFLAEWILINGLEVILLTPATAQLWTPLRYIGICFFPVALFTFAYQYTDQRSKFFDRLSIVLWGIAALILVFIFLNPWHRLVWQSITYLPGDRMATLNYTNGPAAVLIFALIYLCIGLAAAIIIRAILRNPGFSGQGISMLAALTLPVIVDLLGLAGLSQLLEFDPTIIALIISGFILAWSSLKLQLFQSVQLAGERLFFTLSDGVVLLDDHGNVVQVNPAAQALLGNAEITQPKPLHQISAILAENLPDPGSQADIRVPIPDGSSAVLEVVRNPLYRDGQITGELLFLRNVTHQRLIEQQILQNTGELRLIIESIPVMLATVDRQQRFRYVNRAYADFFGRSPANLVGIQARELFSEQEVIQLRTVDSKVMSGERAEVDIELRHQDTGNLHIIRWLMIPYSVDGALEAVIIIGRDVTEEKRQRKLEEKQWLLSETLRSITAAVNSALSLDEVLDTILNQIGRIMLHDGANIGLLEHGTHVRIVRNTGYAHPNELGVAGQEIRIEFFPLLGQVIRTAQPVVIHDTHTYPDWTITPETAWVRSYVAAPIRTRGRVIGLINVDSAQPGFFTQEHANLLLIFADETAAAIEKAQFLAAAQEHAQQMRMLYEIGLVLSSGQELEPLLKEIHNQFNKLIPTDIFYIALYDADDDTIQVRMYYENGEYRAGPIRKLSERPGLIGHIITTQQMMVIQDTLDESQLPAVKMLRSGGVPARTFVGVPLHMRGRVIGVISMQAYQPNAFTQEQIELLSLIAQPAGIAIENARLIAQLHTLATTDPLTNIANRRLLFDRTNIEIERSLRYQNRMSALMLDIDHFKQVNDRFGHRVGDQILQGLCQRINDSLRKPDVLGRYGGEEFAILLIETALPEATQAAERLRDLIARQPFLTDAGQVAITVSIGIAELRPHLNSAARLFDEADRGLYHAKRGGRDRVAIAPAQTVP